MTMVGVQIAPIVESDADNSLMRVFGSVGNEL
jgi:hypothetical protein